MDIAKLKRKKSRDDLLNERKLYRDLNEAKSEESTSPIPPIGTDEKRLLENENEPVTQSDERKRRVYRKAIENDQKDDYEYYEEKFDSGTKPRIGDTAGGVNAKGSTLGGATGDGAINGISSIDKAQFTGDIRAVDGGLHGNISGNVSNIDAPNARVDGGKDSSKKPSKVSYLIMKKRKIQYRINMMMRWLKLRKRERRQLHKLHLVLLKQQVLLVVLFMELQLRLL